MGSVPWGEIPVTEHRGTVLRYQINQDVFQDTQAQIVEQVSGVDWFKQVVRGNSNKEVLTISSHMFQF